MRFNALSALVCPTLSTRRLQICLKKLLGTYAGDAYREKNVLLSDNINKFTVISTSHLTPEIKLHLITPECSLWSSKITNEPFNEPFWAFYWPGGQVISRFILDNGSFVKNKHVLDVGSGCGACGISALKRGAKSVVFNDIDKVALEAVKLNGELNEVDPRLLSSENLVGTDCTDFDVIFIGDMLYDIEFADQVLPWLQELSLKGKQIYIGDPGRHSFESRPLVKTLKCLAKYRLTSYSMMENNGLTDGYVWTFDFKYR